MEAKGRIVATAEGTEGTKELERKPSLQHSISKDDEKMKVKELISDRSTIAVEELKQDVIKANSISIKSVESEEANQIAITTDNGGQNYTAEKDLKPEADINKSADKNDTHQDVSSTDNKDIHKDKQNQIDEIKLESTGNDNLKLDSNKGDKNSAFKGAPTEEIINTEDKHKDDNNDPKDEQSKELKTKLNQPTDHESNLKLDSKTDSDLLSSKEIEKECSKKDKETSENKKTDKTKANPNNDLQMDTKPTEVNKKTVEETEMDCKKNMKNVKENSSQERKVKMIKKKKKKSSIAEEPSEIQFDELLLPKEIEKKCPEKTENSYIVEEPDNEEKVKLNVHQDRESVEISEEKPDTEEKVHPEQVLVEISEVKSEERSPKPWPTGEKTYDDLSPIPAKETKSPENPKIDVTLKATPKVEEPAFSNFELEEVELKSKSSKVVKKDVNEVYLC